MSVNRNWPKNGDVKSNFTPVILVLILFIFLSACSTHVGSDMTTPGTCGEQNLRASTNDGGYMSWGTYDLVIARDGSEWTVAPNRTADVTWGYHLNAVKLLEAGPGHNCIKIENVDMLPNGDLSVDISITHPYDNAAYTGFDVRGIIMFPSSQYIPDNELRELAGLDPYGMWYFRFAWNQKGDTQLINPDGYTSIFAPDAIYNFYNYEMEEGYPIFDYFEGHMASGEDLGTVNGFKRYYSNEIRHMFEAGETVTRTFIIRPPAEGPILASYAVYAHWTEPLVLPVTNPEADFGPEANSPMPYDFWVEQVGPIDLDLPQEFNNENVIWHISSWNFGSENRWARTTDIMGCRSADNAELLEMFDACTDCYYHNDLIDWEDLSKLPDGLPGTWPMLFQIYIDNDGSTVGPHLAIDFYIEWLDIEAFGDD